MLCEFGAPICLADGRYSNLDLQHDMLTHNLRPHANS